MPRKTKTKKSVREKKEELTRRQKLRQRAKASTLRFKREIKKSVSTAIVAAFGFLIALAWKDAITEYIDKITATTPITGKIVSAIIITIIGVIGILLVTKFLVVKE